MNQPLTIRRSTDEDQDAIRKLATLDSRPAPTGDALLAFVGTELRAAVPLDGGEPLADPFRHTAEIVKLLRVRTNQTHPRRRRRSALTLGALRPRTA